MGLSNRTKDLGYVLDQSLSSSLGAESANAILEAYGIARDTPDNVALERTIRLATDILYACPTLSYARAWSGKRYVYQFNQDNPWEGQFQGLATHMLDAAFLFQNYNEKMGSQGKAVARTLAKGFVAFANGVAPWDQFEEADEAVKVFGGTEVERVVQSKEPDMGRSNRLFELAKAGKVSLDTLSSAWDEFLAGK